MTYAQVLESLRIMVANGNFTYLEYLRLVFSNWFSAMQYVTCCLIVIGLLKAMIAAAALYTTTVVKGIKEEIEG